ncbi:hypothetical protein HN51_067170 [Arachis hypogaea]
MVVMLLFCMAKVSCADREAKIHDHVTGSEDNRVESAANQASEASAQQIAKQGLGRFMSLLNSFDNT